MSQFIYKSAIELSQLIRSKKASSTEIVKAHLDRIKSRNKSLNALITIFEEEALKTAEKRDKEVLRGENLGPLHGVPVTIKEQFWIKGEKSTINAKMYKDFIAPEDAVIVRRIKESGAIILGQTNVPKFLMDYQVSGDLHPECKNPYNTEYTPGGSTGGGAAALSAGFTPLELGGDFGGSIRVPANFCGLFGLKPTEKTVPLHGNIPLPENAKSAIIHMAQAGPLARTIEDIELLWKIILGPHPEERYIAKIDWTTPQSQLQNKYRIGWLKEWPGFSVSDQTEKTILQFIGLLDEEGFHTENLSPKGNFHEESLRLWMGLFPYVVAQESPWFVRKLMFMQQKSSILKGEKKFINEAEKGYKLNARHYGEMMALKNKVTASWENLFENYDFLVCPMSFGPAFKRTKTGTKIKYDGKEMAYGEYVWPFVGCFNASGNPAINVPLGLGKEGLPIGVQIVGPYWSDSSLIRFVKLISKKIEGFVKPEGY